MRELSRQLGSYRLVRRLGTGGMAEVFLARAFGAETVLEEGEAEER